MATEEIKKTTKVRKTTAKAVANKTELSALEIPVYSLNGSTEKTISLSKDIFDIEASPRLIAQYVRVYLANQRQGNASTKHRSEVTGTTKKVYRQKGTGNARHGSQKAPLFVGGGVDGGPKPTDHSLKINKKQKRKSLLAVLTMKAKEQSVAGLGADILSMKPKTSAMVNLLKTVGVSNKKVMIVVSSSEEGMKLSVRNLKNVEIASPFNLNTYNVLMNEKLFFTEEALSALSTIYLNK